MKVSVIIPAHNEASVIGASLDAVLAQDYPDFEVIVVDNASTDGTAAAAVAYGRVKVVSETRKGTMWACERGRREATGDIIVRMDADCLPEHDWLSRGTAHFERDPQVVVVSGPYIYYDATRVFRFASFLTQKYLYTWVHTVLRIFRAGGITMGGNTFMRASALERAGGFNTALTFYGDDTDVPKRLSRFGRCVYDPRLVNRTSARRFKAHGTVRLVLTYWYHFFKQLLA